MKSLMFLLFLGWCGVVFSVESDDIEIISKYRLLDNQVKIHTDNWGVIPSEIDIDNSEYGPNQFKDLTEWDQPEMTEEWFSFKNWRKQRKLKDKSPTWRVVLRNQIDSEIIGRVLKCIGLCEYYHEVKAITAGYQTVLREGDEFKTHLDAYAWIVLVDGTLLRISPNSSVSFTEVNVSQSEVMTVLRLNYGYINTIARVHGEFIEDDNPESDLAFLPLLVKKANREYYAGLEYKKLDKQEKLIYEITENPGHILQNVTLNKYISEINKDLNDKKTSLLIYTPNLTINATNVHTNIFYKINAQTYVKVYNEVNHFSPFKSDGIDAKFSLRGHVNKERHTPKMGSWYVVNKKGTQIEESLQAASTFALSEGFLRRLSTFYLAREIYVNTYSKKVLSLNIDKKELARVDQYRLWSDKEIEGRKKFLEEFIRRTETTNIVAINKVFYDQKIEGFTHKYYSYAMLKHYNAIRRMSLEKRKVVLELSESEYYLWLLRNAKKI